MKRLIAFFMFPIIAFGQNTQTQVNATQVNTSTKVNIVNERDLVLSEKSTKVFIEFPDDMSTYTDILIIDASLHKEAWTRPANPQLNWPERYFPESFNMTWENCIKVKKALSGTIFNIQDPQEDRKSCRKIGMNHLKNIKNESYLYLYLRQSKGKGDDINTSFMLRDYNNKLLYRATGINVSFEELLEPLFNF